MKRIAATGRHTGRFDGKVALITGASSGIGASVARALADEGARVVLLARRVERLTEIAAPYGNRALVLRCDVTCEADLQSAVRSTVGRYGKIDVVLANAGFAVVGKLEHLETADFRRQFETNVFGAIHTAKACLAELKKSRGVIAFTGSVAGHVALPENSAYCMSKFALRAFAEALRLELRRDGVGVVLVSPGFVRTELGNVDNRGNIVEGTRAADAFQWLFMDAEVAARQILDSIHRREAERVITAHGKVVVFLRRYFPGILNALVKFGLRGPKKVGQDLPGQPR